MRKPLIQMIGRGQTIPFDVGAARIILVDITDLDDGTAAKDALAGQVESIDAGKDEIDSPISIAVDLKGASLYFQLRNHERTYL